MKQSELKKKLEKKARIQREESEKFWIAFARKPRTYRNIVCENLKYTLGGTDNSTGVYGMCWYCDKCGRHGCNYQNLRKIDKLIEEVCDLEEG